MQEHPNYRIAMRLWDAIAEGDAPALCSLLAEKCTWRMPGTSLLAGHHQGPDAILEFMARVGELSDELQSDLIDLYVAEDGAVIRYSVHAVRGQERLDTEHLFRIQIDDELISKAIFVPVDQRAYDRFFTPYGR